MTQQPQAKYRHDYRAPDYLISDIDLAFDLDAAKTIVTAESQVSRHAASDVPLRLNGEDLTLVSVHVNGAPWADYKEEDNQLVLSGLPERFILRFPFTALPSSTVPIPQSYPMRKSSCRYPQHHECIPETYLPEDRT